MMAKKARGPDLQPQVLYTSTDLHRAIAQVLSDPAPDERRVVIVAYLGAGSDAYLPCPQNLEIVCAMQPLATSPKAIERLRKRGARVQKSERLHMKVYWSNEKGCVIGSANASTNALGKNGLKESGVFLSPGMVDIDRLLGYAKPSAISKKDLERLHCETDKKAAAGGIGPDGPKEKADTYIDWYKAGQNHRWKLGWWNDDDDVEAARAAKEKSKLTYGRYEPADYLNVVKGDAAAGDWLLTFQAPDATELQWMYVDFVVEVPKSDKKAYSKEFPIQAIQSKPLSQCPTPPFKLDRKFKVAFAAATEAYGVDNLQKAKKAIPPEHFLDFIYSYLT